MSVIRDISQRVQTEEFPGEKIEAQVREQATLLTISHTLTSTLEFQPGMILDQLREIIEYTHSSLFALEDSMLVTLAARETAQLEGSAPFHIQLEGPEIFSALSNGH